MEVNILRISWIDGTKTIALLFIILVHSMPNEGNMIITILTGFVMPVFFILYGLTYNKEKHEDNMIGYIKKMSISLMVPYIILTIFMLVMYSVFYPILDLGITPNELLFWSLYGNGPISRVSHLWFLRTMFLSMIIFIVIIKYISNKFIKYSLLILFPQLSVIVKVLSGVDLLFWGLILFLYLFR